MRGLQPPSQHPAWSRRSRFSTPKHGPLPPQRHSWDVRSAQSPIAWVFDCDGEPLLVMASGAHRVDATLLAGALGATQIRKASPQLVRSATGQVIGGVAPTGHPGRLRTVVDESLARHPVIWTAAGTPDSVMPLTYEQLLVVTEGVGVRVR